MSPEVFAACKAAAPVTAIVGSNPCRVYLAGLAPQGADKPYATWQLIGGQPENYLGDAPDIDSFNIQFDAWAKTAEVARTLAMALRDVAEANGYIVSWRGESRDQQTMLYRYSFDVEWMVNR